MYLNCKTWFSFHYGTIRTEELVEVAQAMEIKSLAITNINNTCDLWDFVEFAQDRNIRPVAGVEIRNGDDFCYILLAKNNNGLLQINRFLSAKLEDKTAFPQRFPFHADVFAIYDLASYTEFKPAENEFIGVRASELNRLFLLPEQDIAEKFVALQPVTFRDKRGYNIHRLLRAIDKNQLLSKQQPADYADADQLFHSPVALEEMFARYPCLLANANGLLERCSISIDYKVDKTKKTYGPSMADDRIFLRKLAGDGLRKRYGSNHTEALERVNKELAVIDGQGFNAYFLITWDILRYARDRGFFFVGRGSGANSIVAYCLGITDVDPLQLDLYFERFLNPLRASPPDFDIDFSWRDREEMTDYIFKRYGREHVALLGSYTTFQSRAVIRELGKVFGLPKEEIDALLEAGNDFRQDKIQKQIAQYGTLMKDYPNHLSIHAGGILITEDPVHQYAATDLPPKGFSTTQIDMFIAEKVGLYKLDILSQRGLGHIKDCVELVWENRKEKIDIRDVERFKTDSRVAAQIRAADTIGCFYIESPAMRQLLKKLECDDYLTLVAASSIIRPGVAQSGMMRQYIYRYHNPDKFDYLHPVMEKLLKETYGVMVYQEDVIKVAHHFAGLDLAEADVLRRAMSGKYRGRKEFEKIRNNFFSNCREKGYAETLTAEVWRQIESFGGYSFSKAHSASFAVESYQSLFLKTYYPVEFMVAVINNFGGFYNTELYFHELKRCGGKPECPCVNEGEHFTLIRGNRVIAGFVHVQGLEEKLITIILRERANYGPYGHLQDFIERTNAGLEQLNILIRTGAMRFTGKSKKELLWEANFLQKKNTRQADSSKSLFKEPPLKFTLPQLTHSPLDDALDEIELLGFPLGDVWELTDENLDNYLAASDLPLCIGSVIETIGYYVTTKVTRTAKKETMHFGTFLDKSGQWIDSVHFPQSFQFSPFQGKGFYAMKGRVMEEFGVITLEVYQCRKVGLKGRTT